MANYDEWDTHEMASWLMNVDEYTYETAVKIAKAGLKNRGIVAAGKRLQRWCKRCVDFRSLHIKQSKVDWTEVAKALVNWQDAGTETDGG